MLAAIRTVHAGDSVIAASSTRRLLQHVAPMLRSAPAPARSDDSLLAELTPREREVLALMAEGRSNRAIAEALVVTERAVEKHVTSIFTKLNLTPTVEDHRRVLAVLAYMRAGE
jgi:DNA-binding NarL/FixJ family response regulator